MIDTKELRRLAQAATPNVGRACNYQNEHWIREGHVDFDNADLFIASERPQEDAEFYAAANPATISELLDRLEAAEKERESWKGLAQQFGNEADALRAKIEAMEKQEPFDAGSDVFRSAFEAALKAGNWPATRQGDGYRSPSTQIAWRIAFSTVNRLKLYLAPGAQPAPSVPECPYPCGWRNLLKHAIEDGAYLARSINEDEPVMENARAVTMRTVMRLRDVLLAINNAAPEAKP